MNEINPIIREILEEKRSALKGELGMTEIEIRRNEYARLNLEDTARKTREAIVAIEEELQRDA